VKKLLFAIAVAVIVLVLSMWGNRIAGRTLDAQLAPLLTDVLGLPVALAPIKANLLQLKASSDLLVMGAQDEPAVAARGVAVRISLEALLAMEIRLESASASDLMINVSRWPTSGGPLPPDYHFLDQWLPATLEVDQGRYIDEQDQPYPLAELAWERHGNGSIDVAWVEERSAGRLEIDNTLQSITGTLGGTYIANPMWHELMGQALITVHPLGGCCMADSAESGVVNDRCQVFSGSSGSEVYSNLYVCDGAVMPRSLGTLGRSSRAERAEA